MHTLFEELVEVCIVDVLQPKRFELHQQYMTCTNTLFMQVYGEHTIGIVMVIAVVMLMVMLLVMSCWWSW